MQGTVFCPICFAQTFTIPLHNPGIPFNSFSEFLAPAPETGCFLGIVFQDFGGHPPRAGGPYDLLDNAGFRKVYILTWGQDQTKPGGAALPAPGDPMICLKMLVL